MKEAYNKGISKWGQFGILIGLIGGCLIVGGIVSLILWILMTHGSIATMEKDMLKPQNLNAVLVLQTVSTLLVFFSASHIICVYLLPQRLDVLRI